MQSTDPCSVGDPGEHLGDSWWQWGKVEKVTFSLIFITANQVEPNDQMYAKKVPTGFFFF